MSLDMQNLIIVHIGIMNHDIQRNS